MVRRKLEVRVSDDRVITILITGEPESGKTLLCDGLKQAMLRIPDAPYPWVVSTLGGLYELPGLGPLEASRGKEHTRLSRGLSLEYFNHGESRWEDRRSVLILQDMPGVQDNTPKGMPIFAILVFRSDPEDEENPTPKMISLRSLCSVFGVTVLAEIFSDYNGSGDRWLQLNGIWRGSVHHIEKGEPICERPTVQSLARIITELVPQYGCYHVYRQYK